MSFITSLISISSLATWIFLPLNAIFLTLDGIVYSLVAYSYKIFMLIAQLNYNVLYAWMAPLIDRVKAIILVLIMFKVGYALIQYMINPDKLDDSKAGGPALLKNIAISAVLLISYTFIFSFMNELTLLFIGVPEGYEFTTLKEVAEVANDGKDSGLIARFIFGKEADNVGEFGKQLSVNTLSIFLHSKAGQTSDLDNIYQELANGDMNAFDAMKIVTIVARIDKDVEYKWPLVSTAAGLYLTWQIIKLAIELAIRMFKLLVLQVLAPFAIVSIVDGGMNNGTWSKYVKTFIGIWTDAFIRVGSLFLATALVGQFYNEFDALVPDAANGTITRGLILLIVLFSAYKCTELIPKLIKEVFPSMGSGGDNAKGFIGGLLGAGVGTIAGAATSIAAGNGVGGVLSNTLAGGYNGLQAGKKGSSVASFFKGQADNARSRAGIALANNEQGGPGGRLKNNLLNAVGAAAIVNSGVDQRVKDENETYEKETNNANSKYESEVNAENLNFEQAERDFENRSSQLDNEINSARSTMSSSDSGFTYADGESIQFGANADTFSEAVANNDYKYRHFTELSERYERELQQNNFTDTRDRNGNVVTAEQNKKQAEENLRISRESAEITHREAKQKAQEAWNKKEEELQINQKKQEQKNIETERRNNRNQHNDTLRTMSENHKADQSARDSAHKSRTKEINSDRIPGGK